jgi:hypothetical protein
MPLEPSIVAHSFGKPVKAPCSRGKKREGATLGFFVEKKRKKKKIEKKRKKKKAYCV